MTNFLQNLFHSQAYTPPEACTASLEKNFPSALNVEWHKRKETCEAIFYKDDLEHIALFKPSGTLLEYRVNIIPGLLPAIIKISAEATGEIMNCVMRNKGKTIEYEIIVRKNAISRQLVTFDDLGKITGTAKL